VRNTIRVEPLTRNQVERIILRIENLRDKVFIILLYLTAGRITEVLDLRKRHFDYTTSPDFIIVSIKTLKRKKGVVRRKLPVRKNEPLVSILTDYLKNKELNDKLFSITRQRGWQIIKQIDPRIWPHLFRHTRLSELANKLTDQQLTVYAGWSDSRPAKNYVFLRWTDLAEKL